MKSQQKINLLFFLVILGLTIALIFVSLPGKKLPNNSLVSKNNRFQLIEINKTPPINKTKVFGVIAAEIETDVIMKVNGKIDNDNHALTRGSTFKKNDILIKVDRIEVLYHLLISRLNFKKHIEKSIKEIEDQFPEEKNKWQKFEKSIERTLPLPDFPKVTSTEEETLLNKLNIHKLYYEIKRLEQRAQDHIYVAPFDGFISESTIQPNSMVRENKVLMKLSKNNSFQVITHLPINSLKAYKNAKHVYFVNSSKDTIGSGSFNRIGSELSDSSKVEVFFNVSQQNQSIQNTLVELVLPGYGIKNSVALPKLSVSNNRVFLYSDDKVLEYPIKIITSKEDSVYVEGLPDHCFVISNARLLLKD
ncbi:MAG TPA: efflux RND transporter periplasmic adaptor subunit [Brumimicrobium sp.]|nr:efflux RND transporter periplasmic adaptor subunit [Brumimicrobium sp.]